MRLRIFNFIVLGMLVLLISGCQSTSRWNPFACSVPQDAATVTDKKLNYGVLTYEEGNYQASVTALQGVLEAGLSSSHDKVKAYKYLAFIQCVSGRETMCRDYFRKALELDPAFTLEPAEAGHPIWGPAFRAVKTKNGK